MFAMARPRRPEVERAAVVEAAAGAGTVTARAARLARAVAAAALAQVDLLPDDEIIGLLRALDPSPVARLALDPAVDTAALIIVERVRRLEARGGRRLAEREWRDEDQAILAAVATILARRYRAMLTP